MKHTGLLALLAALLLACSSDEAPSDTVAPIWNDMVGLRPSDLSTSIGDGAIVLRIVTQEPGAPVQARIDRTMPRVTLRTFPSGEVIPFAHSILPPAGDANSAFAGTSLQETMVLLTPSRDLSQGWYALAYDADGDDTQILGVVDNPLRGPRRAEVCFSLESQATVSNVWLAEKAGGIQSLRVTFSEPVRHDAELLAGIELTTPSGSICVPQGESSSATSVTSVTFRCSGEPLDHVGLSLSSSVVSASSGRRVALPRSAAERQASGEVLGPAGSHVDIDFTTQVKTDGGLTSVWIPD